MMRILEVASISPARSRQDATALDAEQAWERKRELNKLAPVSRLVPDTISEILVYVAHDGIDHGYDWLKVTHVCHEWRNIALHSPRVWNHLRLTADAGLAKELIARSKEAPLYVTMTCSILQIPIGLVFSQLNRIRALQLTLDPASPNTCIPSPFFAPELRHLELVDCYSHFTDNIPSPFEELDAPKLEQLEACFSTFYVPWTSVLFKSSITHLHLQSLFPLDHTPHEILAALARMPNLKFLSLFCVLSPCESSLDSRTIVHLPHLETLVLADDCDRCVSLFHHIVFPPNVTLRILLARYGEETLVQLSRQIVANLSDPHSSNASIRSLLCTDRSFAAWRKQLRVTETVKHDRDCDDTDLGLHLRRGVPAFKMFFEEIIVPFPLSNVHTLYLSLQVAFSSFLQSISESMPSIRELGISPGGGDEQEVLNLLVVGLPRPGSTASPPLFPHLKTLLLADVMWSDGPDDDAPILLWLLRKMLRSRKLSKYTINELVLKNITNLGETDIEKLHEFVMEVTWDPDDMCWVEFVKSDSEDKD